MRTYFEFYIQSLTAKVEGFHFDETGWFIFGNAITFKKSVRNKHQLHLKYRCCKSLHLGQVSRQFKK